MSTKDYSADAKSLESQPTLEAFKWVFEKTDDAWISFSGAEDVVLIDLAVQVNPDVKVFSLDTGRLHAETYRFIEEVRKHYNVNIELLSPNAEKLQALVKEKGLFSFYEDGHQECCGIRKVQPLRKKLGTVGAWITGQRRDQSVDTRSDVPIVQYDQAFSTDEHSLIKANPLANWTSEEVWAYIRTNEVPYNKLHEQGFISIGSDNQCCFCQKDSRGWQSLPKVRASIATPAR